MWKKRRLELRNLCDLGRWVLEDPEALAQFDADWRRAAFEACNSPLEWEEFLKSHAREPRLAVLLAAYEAIDSRNQAKPRSRPRQPIDPASLAW